MKVQNSGIVDARQQAVATAKKTAKVATIAGGLYGASSVAFDVMINKLLTKLPKEEMIDSFKTAGESFSTELKECMELSNLPEGIKKLYMKKIQNPKTIKKAKNVAQEFVDNLTNGKINYKPIAKRALKYAGVAALVSGAVYLAGKAVSTVVKKVSDKHVVDEKPNVTSSVA